MKKFLAVFLTIISTITFTGGLTVYAQNSTPAVNEVGMLGEISYNEEAEYEKISITATEFSDYEAMELTDPLRIVIDLKNIKTPKRVSMMQAGGRYVKRVRYAQFNGDNARVLLDMRAGYDYSVEETDNGLTVLVYESKTPGRQDKDTPKPGNGYSLKNITYNNNDDRVYFEIKKANLTNGTKNLKPLYTASLDKSGTVYTVTFPSKNADLEEGFLDIDDEYLKSFEVRKNWNGTTSMIFRGQSRNKYLIYTRDSGNTAITVAKASDVDRKLVLIDAGHGGTATGAYFGKLYEKDLNLDIAKRLDALLEGKGIDTYMIRSDDSNVDNYERAYIANMLGAELFISIHNNAAGSKDIKGIMTLFYPSTKKGFTGRELAKIIQQDLLVTLNNKDLNVRSRPDLIVLRETYMPAAIAEIAFVSNSTDRANLQKESYRQKAAQSLYSSVVKALNKIG